MTLPGHVAVGDPVTATDRNNLSDWMGSPVQQTAWTSSPTSTPPAGTLIQNQMGSASVTTNASGVASITLPAAFPNGVSFWSGSPTSTNCFTCRPNASGVNASTIVFTCLNSAGAAVVSTAVTLFWEAQGW